HGPRGVHRKGSPQGTARHVAALDPLLSPSHSDLYSATSSLLLDRIFFDEPVLGLEPQPRCLADLEPAVLRLWNLLEHGVVGHPLVEVVLDQATMLKTGMERNIVGAVTVAMTEWNVEGTCNGGVAGRCRKTAIVVHIRLHIVDGTGLEKLKRRKAI